MFLPLRANAPFTPIVLVTGGAGVKFSFHGRLSLGRERVVGPYQVACVAPSVIGTSL
jgi:hypothetical protein